MLLYPFIASNKLLSFELTTRHVGGPRVFLAGKADACVIFARGAGERERLAELTRAEREIVRSSRLVRSPTFYRAPYITQTPPTQAKVFSVFTFFRADGKGLSRVSLHGDLILE